MTSAALISLGAFPTGAPYRIDQVTAAPQAMALLFIAEGLLAGAMSWAAATARSRLWHLLAAILLVLVALFFTLASWGNSDTTKLSHFLPQRPVPIPLEPLWTGIAPLVVALPYRMSMVHGLVAAGYAAAPILLARAWGAASWGGWWALLITCSPMLRGFLQNAHTRQALAVLLLLPVLLGSARLVSIPGRWQGIGVLVSALSHNTFVFSLTTSLLPWFLRLPALLRSLLAGRLGLGSRQLRHHWPWLLAGAGVLVLMVALAPSLLERLRNYSLDPYFNQYPLRSVVGRLQRALALSLVLACLQRRLTPLRLLRCPLTLLLLGFGLLYIGIQQSIVALWLPAVTSRLADGIGFFLLILYLAWLDRYRAHWCVLPVLYVTFQYWLEGRLLSARELPCGLNDDFLCIPDRWPWQVRY
jgi:hypothetical protein